MASGLSCSPFLGLELRVKVRAEHGGRRPSGRLAHSARMRYKNGTMASDPRPFELEELVTRPGTYVNPQTEMVVIVDDARHFDAAALEELEGADWVLVSDETPVDEDARDELIDGFQARLGGGGLDDGDDVEDEEEELEPDPDRVDAE